MAYYRKSNIKRTAGKSAVAIAASIIAVILVIVAVFGTIAAGSKGFKEWDASLWFDSWGTKKPTEDLNGAVVTDDGLVVSLNEPNAEENGIMTLSAGIPVDSPYKENGHAIITARVEPADAINTSVTWLIGFVNPDSAWAGGKQAGDYVTMTEQESQDNAEHRILLQRIKGFAEQIKVTAQSDDNPEISASCLVDCLVKYNNLPDVSGTAVIDLDGNISTSSVLINKENLSEGTVSGEFEINYDDYINSNCTFLSGAEKDVFDYFCEKYGDMPSYSLDIEDYAINRLTTHWKYPLVVSFNNQSLAVDINFNFNMLNLLGTIYYEENGEQCDTPANIVDYIKRYGGVVRFGFKLNYLFQGMQISETTIFLDLTLDNTAVKVHVSDVTIDDENIIF